MNSLKGENLKKVANKDLRKIVACAAYFYGCYAPQEKELEAIKLALESIRYDITDKEMVDALIKNLDRKDPAQPYGKISAFFLSQVIAKKKEEEGVKMKDVFHPFPGTEENFQDSITSKQKQER